MPQAGRNVLQVLSSLGGALIEVLHPQITQILLINLCNLWIEVKPGHYPSLLGYGTLIQR